MSLTCTRFQRVVEALNEFQVKSRKFKPALLLTGFAVTTDISHLGRVFSQFGKALVVLYLRKSSKNVFYLCIVQNSDQYLEKKMQCSRQGFLPLDFIFTVNL